MKQLTQRVITRTIVGILPLLLIIGGMSLPYTALPISVAQSASTISGQVTDPVTGDPVANVTVRAFDVQTGEVLRTAFTNLEGNYTLVNLSPRMYRLTFRHPASSEEATHYYVLGPEAVQGINATLSLGSVTVSDDVFLYLPFVEAQKPASPAPPSPPPHTPIACNPSGGTGGLAPGLYDTTIAGQPALIIVGDGYDPTTPTYLAYYLHGDEGAYSNFDLFIQDLMNEKDWIYVAPQAPQTDPDPDPAYRWYADPEGNANLVATVLEEMFSKYNLCRNVLFGAGASGGSVFHDRSFIPKKGGQYPSFFDLRCGAGGMSPTLFPTEYAQLQALVQNADVMNRTELKYTISTGDFLYNQTLRTATAYKNLGFRVVEDYYLGGGHCSYPDGQHGFIKTINYWKAKSEAITVTGK